MARRRITEKWLFEIQFVLKKLQKYVRWYARFRDHALMCISGPSLSKSNSDKAPRRIK